MLGARPLAVLFASTLAIACGCNAHDAGSSGGAFADIGIDLPESGADASIGIPTSNGAILAIEEADAAAKPGSLQFKAVDVDDAVQGVHDPAQGAANVRSFVADPAILAMIGPYNTSVAAAEIPITNDAGLAQVSPATTGDVLTRGPEAERLRRSHPDTIAFFRVCATDARQGVATARYARSLHLSRAFIVDDNEAYGTDMAGAFIAQFVARGGTIVGHEHLARGQSDFLALLTKARALGPDVIFYGGTTSTGGGLLRKQMRDANLANVPFFGGDGIADAEFEKVAGDAADGTYFTVAAPEIERLPSAAAFVAAYRKRFGSAPGPYSANAYTAAQIAIAAIRGAYASNGDRLPDRSSVLARIAKTSGFRSPVGPVGFDRYGDTTDPVLSVYTVERGRVTFVAQLDVRS